ncbi:MAG: phosphodiester glycosidase family protein [Oscillospiraceae bacterium]|nr:phosphodiester glycosidase family protein [Oscillospiraceae bacterium]
MFRKKYLWAVVYSVLLTAFTTYVALDTFVIARVYTMVQPAQKQTEPSAPSAGVSDVAQSVADSSSLSETGVPVVSENTYHDDHIAITLTEYREYNTSIYVADVQLSSAAYLQTALAQDAYGRNVTEKTSEIAARNGAILAVNGDYYGSQESGYVIRGGVLYRESVSNGQEDLVIYEDGSFGIITEGEVSAASLLADGAREVLSFGPALIVDGAVAVTEDEEVGKAKTSNPRTAIGVVDDLHYLFVVSDGRTDASEGLTLYQLASFMESLGANSAYNLDGGGSSTLYFNGEIVNHPTTNGNRIQERSVSDIVYIGD